MRPLPCQERLPLDHARSRFELLKKAGCKDLAQYFQKEKSARVNRQIIVVDEAAELFLTNSLATPQDVRTAKEILSRVSRQGRSLGIHLVVATQRPDSRALDPQIKANLPGVLCFQMVNDISSITVLGTGRATDLPAIPGRGIWKTSLDTCEVQTPYLTTEQAETFLAPHRSDAPPTNNTPGTASKVPIPPSSDLSRNE